MEGLEASSELQSRLSSLSVSSFPGITSKNWDSSPLDRLQSTDLSQNSNSPIKQVGMDAATDTAGSKQAVVGDVEENRSGGDTTTDNPAPLPPLKPASTWSSPGLRELKARLRQEAGGMVTVHRGDIMTVHVPTVPEATQVCWEFATDGYDIGFGIYFDWTPVTSRAITVHISESSDDEDEEEEMEGPAGSGDVEKGSKSLTNANLGEILPVYRQDSHLTVHGGSHQFPGEGTYLLKFDNSYSLWRNKTLYYRVFYSP